jgi:hypothetical protein
MVLEDTSGQRGTVLVDRYGVEGWGGMGVAETIEGVGGGGDEIVSVLITYPFIAGSVVR